MKRIVEDAKAFNTLEKYTCLDFMGSGNIFQLVFHSLSRMITVSLVYTALKIQCRGKP